MPPYSLTDEPDPFELDDFMADFSELEDEALGLEHDLELLAQVLKAMALTILRNWGDEPGTHSIDIGVPSIDVDDDQLAVLERLLT